LIAFPGVQTRCIVGETDCKAIAKRKTTAICSFFSRQVGEDSMISVRP
jgi:hypothetical protein